MKDLIHRSALASCLLSLFIGCSDSNNQTHLEGQNLVSDVQDVNPSEVAVLEIQLSLRDSERVLAGVSVDVQWDDAGFPSKTATRSNAEGLVRVEFEHGAQVLGVTVKPSAYSAPGALEIPTMLKGGQTHHVDLVLPPAAGLLGTVLDVEGLPVAGANVACYFYSPEFVDHQVELQVDVYTTTDDHGRFALGGIPEGPFVLEAAFENQISVWRPGGSVKEGEILRGLEIFMEPAHTVYGQVIDSNDNPIDKSMVVAGKPNRRKNRKPTDNPSVFSHGPRAAVTYSDSDGMFVIPAIPDSQAWNVNVRHPDYSRTIEVIDAGQIDVWVVMKEARSLSGIVRNQDGEPLRQVQLWLLTYQGDKSVGSDIAGKFKFSDLGAIDDVFAIAHHPEHGTALIGPIQFSNESEVLDVSLTSNQSISGRVVDAYGNPLANVGLQIEGDLPRDDFARERLPESFLGLDSLLTNRNGEFRFDNLYPNTFKLSVFPIGKAAVVQSGISIGDEIEIVVKN